MDSAESLHRVHVVHTEPCPEPGQSGRQGTLLETPYDGAFVAEIKERWKHGERCWSPGEEVWWVVAGNEDEIEELVIEHFGGCVVVDEDGSEMVRDASGDYRQEGFF